MGRRAAICAGIMPTHGKTIKSSVITAVIKIPLFLSVHGRGLTVLFAVSLFSDFIIVRKPAFEYKFVAKEFSIFPAIFHDCLRFFYILAMTVSTACLLRFCAFKKQFLYAYMLLLFFSYDGYILSR